MGKRTAKGAELRGSISTEEGPQFQLVKPDQASLK